MVAKVYTWISGLKEECALVETCNKASEKRSSPVMEKHPAKDFKLYEVSFNKFNYWAPVTDRKVHTSRRTSQGFNQRGVTHHHTLVLPLVPSYPGPALSYADPPFGRSSACCCQTSWHFGLKSSFMHSKH